VLGVRLLVPYYHLVGDAAPPHIRHLFRPRATALFRRDLDLLLRRFTPVPLHAIIDSLRRGKPLPSRSFHVTFDDGYREVCETAAPILREKGVPATFFLNTSFLDNRALGHLNLASLLVEETGRGGPSRRAAVRALLAAGGIPDDPRHAGLLAVPWTQRELLVQAADALKVDVPSYLAERRPYLSSEEVRGLIADGFTLGAHGLEHPLYREIPLAEQLRQTLESVREMRERFLLPYGAFAFPHTDRGVTRRYFEEVAASGLVDVSFGTGGLTPDGTPGHLQRFSLEKLPLPADRLVAWECAKLLRRKLTGRGTARRE
jgi:peptidoglycan/xylan/chitin deacetylase (PgdA/CDA1 family)